jgi:hypothetical protein
MSNDLNFEKLSTVQSKQQQKPVTLASAATISPTTKFTRITGTTPITKITPPAEGYHELTLVFTSAYGTALNTGGSGDGAIATAITSVADRPVTVYYDPRTKLYYVQWVGTT